MPQNKNIKYDHKKHIKEILTQYLNEHLLKEYVTRNEVYLKDYLAQSKEAKMSNLPHEYYYFFDDFLIETDTLFERPKETQPSLYADEPDEEVDMFDDDLELMTYLERHDKNIFNLFAQYLYDKISNNTLTIPYEEYPAWSYFDDNPQIVKNQWLIHFTDNAQKIASEGFKYGVDDMSKLGLTTNLGEFDKKYGGYNFAYLLYDFPKYGRSNQRKDGYKYGSEAVIFNASGIKTWHFGDEEYQVIFYGNTATNIIPIISGEKDKWGIYNKKDRILFENDDLVRVVDWIAKNYAQYRKNFVYK